MEYKNIEVIKFKICKLFLLFIIFYLNCQVEKKQEIQSSFISDQCMEGNCKDGIGKMQYLNGSLYFGSFKNGKQNGKGKEIWKGFQYEGDFLNDEKTGVGKLTFPDGANYLGGFKKGNFNGKGVFKKPNGNTIEGEWVDGNLTGKAKSILEDGTTYLGPFQKGVPEGQGEETYPNGMKYVGQWSQGFRHGKGILFDSRENILVQGNFTKGGFPENYTRIQPDSILLKDVNSWIQKIEYNCSEIENLEYFQLTEDKNKTSHVWIYNICDRGVGYFINFYPDKKGGSFFEIDLKKTKINKNK